MLAFLAERMVLLSPAQITLLGALLMAAAGGTLAYIRLIEGSEE